MKANNEEETEVFTEDEIYIATLLCHFLELMQFNSHEVAQVTTDGLKKFRTKWKLYYGFDMFIVYLMFLKQMQLYSLVWDGCEEYWRRFKISLYRSSGISNFSNVQSFLRSKHSSILYWKYSLCTGESKWIAFEYDTLNVNFVWRIIVINSILRLNLGHQKYSKRRRDMRKLWSNFLSFRSWWSPGKKQKKYYMKYISDSSPISTSNIFSHLAKT